MTGSLQTKNDKFYIVLNTRDANGKRKNKWISTGLEVKGNKKRAEKLLRNALAEYEKREKLVHSDMTFADAIREWLRGTEIRIDQSTYQSYTELTRTQILPYFDALGVKLIDVDRKTLQAYIDEKHRNGRLDGTGGLSPATIRHHKNVLFQTLRDAVKNDLIHSNPCEFVALPQKQRHEASFYTADQCNALFNAIRYEPLYPLIKVTAVYGLRRSETLGLKWDSIDFNDGRVTIKHTVVRHISLIEKDKTKNASSYRSFPLLPEMRSLFLDLKRQDEENRKLFGRSYTQSEYIFKWADGRPFAPDFVTQKFATLLKKHDLPHIRFHDLRHSCASNLLAMGFNLKDVSEWLGHSDIQITANTYAHLDVTRKQAMADKLGAAFSAHNGNVLEKALEKR